MRIALITTVYRRPELTSIVLDHYADLSEELEKEGIFVTIYAAISPGDDPDLTDAFIKRHNRRNVYLVEAPNEPLSDKWNAVSIRASQDDPDAIIIFGSDDVMNETFLRLLIAFMEYGHDVVTPESIYFFSPSEKKASLLTGARIGAGRAFSRRFYLESSGELWPSSVHITPDQSQNELIERMDHTLFYFDPTDHVIRSPQGTETPLLLDVKTQHNRWPFSSFTPERNPACTHADARKLLFDNLPERTARALWEFSPEQTDPEPCTAQSPPAETYG